ncbi:MAG: flagellin, partial [Firmicutes bacterium]|nr:flagellin [Bacillota bacterium]
MRIQHNIAALNSYRNLSNNNGMVSKNLEKLSSGYKINRAGDDAAGLAISEKMRAQITGLEVAQKNASDGISLVQTAEGALAEVHTMLNRMIELADQSANGTYDNEVDRANLQKEVKSLLDEVDRIAEGTNFNGINLLNGDLASASVTISEADQAKIASVTISGGNGDVVDFFMFTFASGTDAVAGTDATPATLALNVADDGLMVNFKAVGGAADGKANISDAGLDKAVAEQTITFEADMTGITEEAVKAKYEGMKVTVNLAAQPKVDDGTVYGKGVAGTTGLTLQVGDTSEDFNKLTVFVGDMHAEALGINGVDVSTQDGAAAAIDTIRTAINSVSSTRGDLG